MERPLPSKADVRTFFYRLFSRNPTQRRTFLKHWLNPYPMSKPYARLADVFQELMTDLLYEPMEFKLRSTHFCLFARGKASLAMRFEWLKKKDRDFLVWGVFAHREELFKNVKRFENNQFDLSGFVFDPSAQWGTQRAQSAPDHPYERICDPMWQREIVRDFAWMVLSKKEGYMHLELMAALQEMMLVHPIGRRDVYLASLHSASPRGADQGCWRSVSR